MRITDQNMSRKFQEALDRGGNEYTLDDIEQELASGNMQSHVHGDTWAITQVHQTPRKKSVNIVFVVGNMEDSLKLEKDIINWAREIGADRITGIGRDGWASFATPGWRKIGVLYSKDVSHER